MQKFKPCVGGFLHKFVEEYRTPQYTIEICDRCFFRYVVRKAPNGTHEMNEYRKLHARDFIQPYEPLYRKEYPGKVRQL